MQSHAENSRMLPVRFLVTSGTHDNDPHARDRNILNGGEICVYSCCKQNMQYIMTYWRNRFIRYLKLYSWYVFIDIFIIASLAMMMSSNGNVFRVTGHLCGEFIGPAQRPVTRSFDVFIDLRLNKRLSKQSWGWWFEMLSHPLWRHRNAPEAIVWSKPNPSKPWQNGSQIECEIFTLILLMKICVFWFKFYWDLFLNAQLTISQHYFK